MRPDVSGSKNKSVFGSKTNRALVRGVLDNPFAVEHFNIDDQLSGFDIGEASFELQCRL